MQLSMIRIYFWDKKLKKRSHIMEADMIKIEKNIDLVSLAPKGAFFTGRVLNDDHCACLSNKSFLY